MDEIQTELLTMKRQTLVERLVRIKLAVADDPDVYERHAEGGADLTDCKAFHFLTV